MRLRKLCAGLDLRLQTGRLPSWGRIDRIVGASKEEIGAAADLAARRQFAQITKASRRCEKSTRIEIKYRFCIRLVAGARIVTSQHQQVAYTRCGGAKQIALYRDAVTVAAGELQDRFDALLHKHRGRRNGAEMGPRPGTIGNVHGIGETLQRQRFCKQFGTVGGHRRSDFRSDYKLLGAQLVLQSGRHPTQVAKSSGRCK